MEPRAPDSTVHSLLVTLYFQWNIDSLEYTALGYTVGGKEVIKTSMPGEVSLKSLRQECLLQIREVYGETASAVLLLADGNYLEAFDLYMTNVEDLV